MSPFPGHVSIVSRVDHMLSKGERERERERRVLLRSIVNMMIHVQIKITMKDNED